MSDAWLEPLTEDVCLRLLREGSGGAGSRSSWTAMPIILPVNYRLVEPPSGALLVVRTRPGNVIEQAPTNVAFEIDSIDRGQHHGGWSVLVRGELLHAYPGNGSIRTELYEPGPWLTDQRDAWMFIDPVRDHRPGAPRSRAGVALSPGRLHVAPGRWRLRRRGRQKLAIKSSWSSVVSDGLRFRGVSTIMHTWMASSSPLPRASGPAVRAECVSVVRGGRHVVRDLDFAIGAGWLTGLIEPAESGKTTLMRAIVGVQQNVAGRLTVLGDRAGVPGLRSRVAYLTQALSIYADLSVLGRIFGTSRGWSRNTAGRGRRRVGDGATLCSHRTRRVRGLSGGEQARVSLTTVLLGEPELLVLDEPTMGSGSVAAARLVGDLRIPRCERNDVDRFESRHGRGRTLRAGAHPTATAGSWPTARRTAIRARTGAARLEGRVRSRSSEAGTRTREGRRRDLGPRRATAPARSRARSRCCSSCRSCCSRSCAS